MLGDPWPPLAPEGATGAALPTRSAEAATMGTETGTAIRGAVATAGLVNAPAETAVATATDAPISARRDSGESVAAPGAEARACAIRAGDAARNPRNARIA